MVVDRKALMICIINTQQRNWGKINSPQSFWCPLTHSISDQRNADLHEAFIRRGRNVPDWITMSPWNCVAVRHDAHLAEGQTDDAKAKIWIMKANLGFDIPGILKRLYTFGFLQVEISLPDIPVPDIFPEQPFRMIHKFGLPSLAYDIYDVIDRGGYLGDWELSKTLGVGNFQKYANTEESKLLRLMQVCGIIRELPDFHHRYEIVK